MGINGYQKLTLLDYPGRIATTVFFDGCDFRCPWCHNLALAMGSHEQSCTEKDFFDYVTKRAGIIDGVAITGGEPLLYPKLEEIILRIRDLGLLVKLDTNGYHPDRLIRLMDSNLIDYVAMDIKNSLSRYQITIDVPNFRPENIERSIEIILGSGIDHEFRTTVVHEYHDDDSFAEIGPLIKGAQLYALQKYTYHEAVTNQKRFHEPTEEDMLRYRDIVHPYVDNIIIRGMDITQSNNQEE